MSHTVHPYAHRLVNLRGWKSKWFAQGQKYRDYLKNDILIREFLEKKLRGKYVGSIEFKRDQKSTKIVIESSRPGFIIGKSGEGIQELTKEVIKEMKRRKIAVAPDFSIDVVEIKNPDAHAMIVAQQVAEGLERRLPFRRVMKQMLDKVMQSREVKGAKIGLSGRLGGNEMSRKEEVKRGGIPLQFIRGDVDYASYRANLPYGVIGIKVWIYKGDSLEKEMNNS
ncbi:30S ribosomal protein S3 [Candidatus Campbellbacteria bacterium]|nr:30S ribosomal protein S3 [Candidatus Campbellbacteria bacterium]